MNKSLKSYKKKNCQDEVYSKDKHYGKNSKETCNISDKTKKLKSKQNEMGYDEDIDRKRKMSTRVSKDMEVKSKKILKPDTLELMSRLEQFSNVWNDCPDVNKTMFVDNINNSLKVNNVRKEYEQNHEHNTTQQFEYYQQSSEEGVVSNKYNTNQNINKKCIKTKTTYPEAENVKDGKLLSKVNGKTSQDLVDNKNANSELSDLKRKKAVTEHRQLYVDKQKLIKQALSGTLDGEKVNKKVIFNDDSDYETGELTGDVDQRDERPQLFEESDDSGNESGFKVNPQFEGKKGHKLLELQSKYASDSRFTLDTRFYESDSEGGDKEVPELENQTDEKEKQLAILGSIVKREIKPLSTIKKSTTKGDELRWMVRFDPTREEHNKYIIKPNKTHADEENSDKRKKKVSSKQKEKEENHLKVNKEEENKTKVSDEKFYSVKEDLKEVLKTEKKPEFSLLKLFGTKEDKDSNTAEVEESHKPKKHKYSTKNPFKYDSSDSEQEEEKKIPLKKRKDDKSATSTWRTTFFFTENDSRLQEALEFLKAPENQEDGKEFAEKRKLLKVFIKNKFKNNHRKNGIFKKKLGGLKRKVISKKKLKKS